MQGIWTVIPTIFNDNNIINIDDMKKLINHQIGKVSGVVLNGTTSEVSTLSSSEKSAIYNNIALEYISEIPIMIGISGNDTREIEYQIEEILSLNTYIMLTVPYYNKPSQEGLYAHFTHIANKYKNKKFIIYNIPGRSGVNLEVDTLVDIVNACPNIIGVKEASGNIHQIKETINRTNISVMCGDDSLFIPAMSIGCKGVISVISNLVPQEMTDIYNECKNNDFKLALSKFNMIEHVAKTCFLTSNPVPLKMILYRMKLISSEYVRLPLVVTKNQKIIQDIDNCAHKIIYDRSNKTVNQIKEEIASLI